MALAQGRAENPLLDLRDIRNARHIENLGRDGKEDPRGRGAFD
jgi:hypothetical protein